MKKIVMLMAVVAVAVFAVSCKKNAKEEKEVSDQVYTNVIPKDSKILFSVNYSKLVPSDGVPSEFFDMLEAKSSVRNKELKDFVEYLRKENGGGIDFSQPAYFFPVKSRWYAVMAVKDKDKVKELLSKVEKLTGKFKEEDGVTYMKESEAMLAFNNTTLIAAFDDDVSVKKGEVLAFFSQKTEDSFASTDDFKKLTKQEGAVGFFMNTDMFKDTKVEKEFMDVKERLAAFIPEDLDLFNLCVMGNLTFTGGRADLHIQTYSNDADNQKVLDKTFASKKSINPESVLCLEDFECCCAVNMTGEEFLKIMKLSPRTLDDSEKSLILSTVFSNIKGNMSILVYDGLWDAFLYSDYAIEPQPKFIVKAQLVNVTAIEQLIGMAKNAPADEFRELADHTYFINNDGDPIYVKIMDDYIYASSDFESINKIEDAIAVSDDVADEMEDAYSYIWVNLKEPSAMLSKQVGEEIAVDRFTIAFCDNAELRLSLVMEDAETPIMDQVWDIFMTLTKKFEM